MQNYLENKIAECQERIAKLDNQMQAVASEQHAYQTALQHLLRDVSGGVKKKAKRRAVGGTQPVSDKWKRVMQELDRLGNTFSTNDMISTAADVGVVVKLAAARSRVGAYARTKYIERAGYGVYRITKSGLAAFGIEQSSENSEGDAQTDHAEPSVAPDPPPRF